jgi:ABC-2 type transport system permease protein
LRTATRPSTCPASSKPRGVAAAFARRDFSITRSYRLPFVLDIFYGVLQFATYFFISKTFSDVGASDLGGAPDYFSFAAIGIVLSLVVAAASDGIATRVREEQLSGSLEALMAQPLGSAQLCLGLTAFPFAYALARAAVYLLIAGVAMDLDLGTISWAGVLVVLVTSAAALSALGILAGAVVLVWKRGATVAAMLIYAMTLLGGSVFPVSELPNWLDRISTLVPLRYAYHGLRNAVFLGNGWIEDALALAAFAIVGLPLALLVFRRALHVARRSGSLGQY